MLTLGSLWFFEEVLTSEGQVQHNAHKLSLEGLFWSFHFNKATRVLLVNMRPSPHARHVVLELSRVNVTQDVTRGPDFNIVTNVIFDNKRGGTFKERSFLRSALCQLPDKQDQLAVLYGRGSAQSDHKLIVQELGSEKLVQAISIEKPLVDICSLSLNSDHLVCVLTENDLHIYKWT